MVLQQEIDNCGIVEKTMDIGTDAMVCLKDGLICVADALMYLVAPTLLTIELEGHLTGHLLSSDGSMDGQQAETWQIRDTSLDAVRVFNRLS